MQTSHLKGFHDCLVLRGVRAALAVRVERYNFDFSGPAAESSLISSILKLVLNRDLCARPQLLDKLASAVGHFVKRILLHRFGIRTYLSLAASSNWLDLCSWQ